MACDLDQVFGKLAKKLPKSPKKLFLLSAQNLPVPPEQMATDKLYIAKSKHRYGGYYEVDMLWFNAHQETYRQLALLTLALVFHEEPVRVELELTHPASDIKHLIVEFDYETLGWDSNYVTRPYTFEYQPVTMKEWWEDDIRERREKIDYPSFRLSNMGEDVSTEEEYKSRDTVYGFGTDKGHVYFAEYLLNIGRLPYDAGWLELTEGQGRISYWSAEARFILPGNPRTYWRSENWPTE